jgi:hypothetical protein
MKASERSPTINARAHNHLTDIESRLVRLGLAVTAGQAERAFVVRRLAEAIAGAGLEAGSGWRGNAGRRR